MAVKFSDFTPIQDASDANELTQIVGFATPNELNVKIPPANLDTTYAVSTGNAGASPTISIQGTKPGQVAAITPSTVSLTGAGGTALVGDGSTAISFTSTTYALAAGVNADPAVNTPVTLTGLAGGDAHTDTVNLIGTGTVQITSTGGVITIDGGSAGDVTSLNQVAGATSTGQALTVAGTGTGPFTGAVTVASNIYGGTTNIGIVPSGGSATTFLQGDGNWATPTDTDTTYTVDVPTGTTSINLKGSNATDDAIVLVGGTDIGLVRDSANQITINSQAVGGVTSVDETTPGTSSGTPIVVNPTTGTVLVQSMAYAGQGNVGHVPAGGVAGQYLDGDIGAWITLPSTLSIDKQTFTGNGTLTDFTLTTAAGCTADNLNIYISGVYQNSVDASNAVNYTVTSGLNPTLQFVSAGTPTAPPVTATRGIEVVITR